MRDKQPNPYPRPDPIEPAKLAGILLPTCQSPEAALKKAMKLYVQAVLFRRDLPSNFDELVREIGTDVQRLALNADELDPIFQANWDETLELNSHASDDPARRFLRERGMVIDHAKGVMENLFGYYRMSFSADIPTHLRNPSAVHNPAPHLRFLSGSSRHSSRAERRAFSTCRLAYSNAQLCSQSGAKVSADARVGRRKNRAAYNLSTKKLQKK